MIAKPRSYSLRWSALALGALSLAQVGLWLAPTLLPGGTPAARAQAFTEEEITSYARAAYAIELSRLKARDAASNILATANSELDILETKLSCSATRLADMPDIPRAERVELRTLLVNFCNEASDLVAENDLTSERFNDITAAHQEDEDLRATIQKEIAKQ